MPNFTSRRSYMVYATICLLVSIPLKAYHLEPLIACLFIALACRAYSDLLMSERRRFDFSPDEPIPFWPTVNKCAHGVEWKNGWCDECTMPGASTDHFASKRKSRGKRYPRGGDL